MFAADPPHGSVGAFRIGCRCTPCKAAVVHGKLRTYWYGCRCELCTPVGVAAAAQRWRVSRARREEAWLRYEAAGRYVIVAEPGEER